MSTKQQRHGRCKQPLNLPPIVFSIQQEVGANDGNTYSDNGKYDEDKKHKSIHVIDLVRPERREYEVPKSATQLQSVSAHSPDTKINVW